MTMDNIFSVVRYEGVVWFMILVRHLLLTKLKSSNLRGTNNLG